MALGGVRIGPTSGERSGAQPDDATSFERFYVAEVANAARLAHVLTGSPTHSLDLAHEAMIVVQRRWDGIEHPRAFLRGTIVNLSRHRRRRRLNERRWLASRSRADVAVTGDPEIDEMWSAVCHLPERQRHVVALRFYEDIASTRSPRCSSARNREVDAPRCDS